MKLPAWLTGRKHGAQPQRPPVDLLSTEHNWAASGWLHKRVGGLGCLGRWQRRHCALAHRTLYVPGGRGRPSPDSCRAYDVAGARLIHMELRRGECTRGAGETIAGRTAELLVTLHVRGHGALRLCAVGERAARHWLDGLAGCVGAQPHDGHSARA